VFSDNRVQKIPPKLKGSDARRPYFPHGSHCARHQPHCVLFVIPDNVHFFPQLTFFQFGFSFDSAMPKYKVKKKSSRPSRDGVSRDPYDHVRYTRELSRHRSQNHRVPAYTIACEKADGIRSLWVFGGFTILEGIIRDVDNLETDIQEMLSFASFFPETPIII